MASTQNLLPYKNLLIGAGAYYLLSFLIGPLAFGFGKITQGLTYTGDFNSYVVAPLVVHFPKAIVAAPVGATTVWFVNSQRPLRWAFFPAALYAVFGFLGYHWVFPPGPLDRLQQTISAVFPALTCLGGALLARRPPQPSNPKIPS